MNFIVKQIRKSFHKWNFQDVNTNLNSPIYMQLIPWADSRFDLGKNYVICNDDYDKHTSHNRQEEFLDKKIINEVSISIFNYDEFDDEHKKEFNDNCGTLIHDENFVGIEIALRGDVFKEIQHNILLNKPIINFSLDFKKHHEKDNVSYGSDWNGSHRIWTKEKEDNKRLDIQDYNIAFKLYELPETFTYEEKEELEDRKYGRLTTSIQNAILYSHQRTKSDLVERNFNELKPYLKGILVFLGLITLKLFF